MKIYPVKSLEQAVLVQRNQSAKKNQFNSVSLPNYSTPVGAYSSVAFKGDDLSGLKSELLTLEDIHCPGCGQKMLSRDKLNKIVDQAAKARNMDEYVKILQKNYDYFKPDFRHFIDLSAKVVASTPDIKFDDLYKIINKGASTYTRNNFDKNVEYLENLLQTEKVSDNDRQILTVLKDHFKNIEIFPRFTETKSILLENCQKLDTDKKWGIYEDLKENAYKSSIYKRTLVHKSDRDIGLPMHAVIVKNMLNYSLGNFSDLFLEPNEDKRYNKLLLCSSCQDLPRVAMFGPNKSKAQQNVELYIKDISNAVAEGKLKNNKNYLYEFIGSIRSFTKGRINVERNILNSVAKKNIFADNKSEYRFANYSGIPCACCGTVTLTHDEKQELYKQIQNCTNLQELKNVVKLNYNHVNPKYKNTVKLFMDLVSRRPDMSEDEVMNCIKISSMQNLSSQIEQNKKALLDYQAKNNLNYLDKEFIKDFIYEIDKKYKSLKYKKEFRYDEYEFLIYKTLKKVSGLHRDNLLDIAEQNLKSLYVNYLMSTPTSIVIEKTGGEAKAMIQNIFRASVLTVDHIHSKNTGGEDEYYNKVGYCRDCNREKSSLKFSEWYKKHPEIKQNLPKHLKKISEIIKKEKMKDMYDYPENVAKQSMRLTKGKLKISDKYD